MRTFLLLLLLLVSPFASATCAISASPFFIKTCSNDTIDEPDETTSIVVGGVSATGTINDDDATPTITGVTSDAQTEGTSLVHTVTLSNASSVATTYSFALSGVTATARSR